MLRSATAVSVEWKFASTGAAEGEIEGYGAVFGNVDGGGDLILPGAFKTCLKGRKARGGSFPILVQHGFAEGFDPVGRWTDVREDSKGLHVRGRLSGMDTERGKFNLARVKDGTFGGLSIGYGVRPENVSYGETAGEPRRTLKAIELFEISLVDEPMNALARISEVKRERLRKSADAGEIALNIPMRDGMSITDALAYALDEIGLTELEGAAPAVAAKALFDRHAPVGGDHAAAFWAAFAGLPR